MDYIVTAGLEPQVQTTELDPLQQEGVVSLLDQQLGQVEGVAGPADEDIDVLDYRIDVRPDGATVMLAMDAPTLPAAEQAAATVLNELLGESHALAGWTVSHSEVRITEDEFNQSLAAAGGETADSSGTEAQLEAAIEEALEGSDIASDESIDPDHWRAQLTELAARVHAFDHGAFDTADAEQAKLAMGALVHAVGVVTDELFYDEMALTINDATVGQAVGLLVMEELPPCYQHSYDARFTRALLLASSAVAVRLTEVAWQPPRCVAEELALRLFINEARVLLEAAGLMEWERSEPLFAAFVNQAFTDTSHDELFHVTVTLTKGTTADDDVSAERVEEIESELRIRGLAFDQWFDRRDGDDTTTGEGIHPYCS